MSDDRRPPRQGDYRAARIGAAIVLIVVVAVMLVTDPFVTDHDADPVAIAICLGTALTLLGLEAGDIIRGGRP